MLNKFLPLCEPPLSPCSSPGQPFYWPPALRGPIAPGIREAAECARETSKSDRERGATLGTILGREGLLSVQKGASRVRNAESEGGGDARGPGQAGTAGGDCEQPRIPNLSRQRNAAREQAGGRGAERGAARRGVSGLQAGSSFRAPGRKEACLRAGKGRGEAEEAKSPPQNRNGRRKRRKTQRISEGCWGQGAFSPCS